jgi:hypothetical protein
MPCHTGLNSDFRAPKFPPKPAVAIGLPPGKTQSLLPDAPFPGTQDRSGGGRIASMMERQERPDPAGVVPPPDYLRKSHRPGRRLIYVVISNIGLVNKWLTTKITE